MIHDIHSAITSLRETKGSNAKKDLLTKLFSEVPGLASFLVATYDPRAAYYQSKLNLTAYPKMLVREKSEDIADIYPVLQALDRKEFMGAKGAQALAQYALRFDSKGHELVQMILDRDIKAGLAEKSINQAYMKSNGNNTKLINTLPYHRYANMTIELLKKMNFSQGVVSQLKSDGMFANIICTESGVQVLSRSGSPLEGGSVEDLKAEFKNVIFDTYIGPSVFHGELLVFDTLTGVFLTRSVGNGKLNSVIQKGEALDSRYQVRYRVWDVVPYQQWFECETVTTPYHKRLDIIQQIWPDDDAAALVRVQETRIVYSFEEAIDHFKDTLSRKEEGTIDKDMDMPWEDGTSSEGLKLKLEMECELEIIGFNEGDQKGKHADTFGSLLCRTSDGLLIVGVSGISDALRKEIWENQADYLGKIIACLSNGVQDKTDNDLKSLFLPRLVEIRLDKKEANSLAEVYEIQESVIHNILVLLEAA